MDTCCYNDCDRPATTTDPDGDASCEQCAAEALASLPAAEICYVKGRSDLYHRYPGQTEEQGCYVELTPEDDTPTLSASWNGEIGNAVPARVWHGRILRWGIPCLTADAANRLLDKLLPLARRVVSGYSCGWNGSSHVGELDDLAQQASDKIERLCAEAADGDPDAAPKAWDAADWYAPLGNRDAQRRELGITADTTDEELCAIETREEEDALATGECDGIDGLGQYLRRLRECA